MKNLKNKAVGLIVTTALLASALLPTACNAREARDIEKIQEISQQFIDTFSTGDKKALNEIVEEDYFRIPTGRPGPPPAGAGRLPGGQVGTREPQHFCVSVEAAEHSQR